MIQTDMQPGAMVEQAPEVEVEPFDQEAPEEDEKVRQLISRFEAESVIPGWLMEEYKQLEEDRQYVHTDSYAHDDADRVAANFIQRSIYQKLAQIFPSDPTFDVVPAAPINVNIARGMGLDTMALDQQYAGERAFAETMRVLVQHLFDEAMGGLIVQGAAQDALTAGLHFIKVTWAEDRQRDALGMPITNDSQDQIDRIRRLATEYQAGEFGPDDAQYQELIDLGEYMVHMARQKVSAGDPRAMRLAQLAQADPGAPIEPYLVPEVNTWLGPVITPVLPDNIRFDWGKVTSPEMLPISSHMTERTFMTVDAITERWHLSEEEAKLLRRGRGNTTGKRQPNIRTESDVDDPSGTDLEDQARGGDEVAVYERWDRENHRLYIWAAGLPRFLHTEIPEVVGRRFYPYVPIYYNRTSGKFMPRSDVFMSRKMQDKINDRLTDFDDALVASYDRYGIARGSLNEGEKEDLEAARPHEVIEFDDVEALKAMVTIAGKKVNASDYDFEMLMRLIEQQMGLPIQDVGNAKFATEVQVANDHMLAQSGRHGVMLMEAMRQIGELIGDYAVAAMPSDNVVQITGGGGYWPVQDRESIFRGMRLEIKAAGTNKQAKRENVEALGAASAALQNLAATKQQLALVGYDFDIEDMAEAILGELDIRVPVDRVIMPMAPPMVGGMPVEDPTMVEGPPAEGPPV